MKKVVLLSGVLGALILTGCSNNVAQLSKMGLTNDLGKKVASTSKTANKAQGKCIPRMSGGDVSVWSLGSKVVINTVINTMLEQSEEFKDVKLPNQFLTTCHADAGLKYIETISNRYFDNQNEVNLKILKALEQNDEVQQKLAELKDIEKTSDRAVYNERVSEQTEQIMELLQKHKLKDKKLISEARGIYTLSMAKYVPTIVMWDKEIASFAQDNIPWAIKNIGSVKTVGTQFTSILMTFKNLGSDLEQVMLRDGVKYDKRAGSKAAAKITKVDKKVLRSAKKEFAQEFDS